MSIKKYEILNYLLPIQTIGSSFLSEDSFQVTKCISSMTNRKQGDTAFVRLNPALITKVYFNIYSYVSQVSESFIATSFLILEDTFKEQNAFAY